MGTDPPPSAPPASDRDPDDATPDLTVGAGPHPLPWPTGEQYDPVLLEHGDRRNVLDEYRYWTVAAIITDLDSRRHEFVVAIENWQHDANIGTVVRTANAFLAREVLIVGRKRWNRRGAMVTDRYQHLRHLPSVADLVTYAEEHGYQIVGIDNTAGSVPIETAVLPRKALFLFGQEGPGLTDEAHRLAAMTLSIAQFGSTRSINAGVAAGIAMHAWIRQYADIAGGHRGC
jgi:tRNA G18 (ribose-2'-O)-methylase SpoU